MRSFIWFIFFCIWTEYRKIRTRKNSVFGRVSRSDSTTESTKRHHRIGISLHFLRVFFSHFSRWNLFNQHNFKMAAPNEQEIMKSNNTGIGNKVAETLAKKYIDSFQFRVLFKSELNGSHPVKVIKMKSISFFNYVMEKAWFVIINDGIRDKVMFRKIKGCFQQPVDTAEYVCL